MNQIEFLDTGFESISLLLASCSQWDGGLPNAYAPTSMLAEVALLGPLAFSIADCFSASRIATSRADVEPSYYLAGVLPAEILDQFAPASCAFGSRPCLLRPRRFCNSLIRAEALSFLIKRLRRRWRGRSPENLQDMRPARKVTALFIDMNLAAPFTNACAPSVSPTFFETNCEPSGLRWRQTITSQTAYPSSLEASSVSRIEQTLEQYSDSVVCW